VVPLVSADIVGDPIPNPTPHRRPLTETAGDDVEVCSPGATTSGLRGNHVVELSARVAA
jgi:hypothetical protein